MKVAIGIKLKSGSSGGGNQFGALLIDYLKRNNVDVVNTLDARDVDIILLTDSREQSLSRTFGPLDIMKYIRKINKKSLVVQRVNECDERKGTITVNKQIYLAGSISDHTVYISRWLRDLFVKQGPKPDIPYSIINNGADKNIFVFRRKFLPKDGKVKIVTHHFSRNTMKGWDVYLKLDKMLKEDSFGSKFEFHYIGKPPDFVKTDNIIYHDYCNKEELADKLNDNHIYLSASINEPAGMHHIEAALCGVPLLYRDSGALPEYCREFGVSFNGPDDVREALAKLIGEYEKYSKKMNSYDNDGENMCSEYFELFKRLLGEVDKKINSKKINFFLYLRYKIIFYYYYLIHKFGIEKLNIDRQERKVIRYSLG